MLMREMQTSSASILPTLTDLEAVFHQRYGAEETWGWSPARRYRFRYFLPAEYYESTVRNHVTPGCCWLDVGGGHSIFQQNVKLARELVSRCSKVVAVDPSENVFRNELVHEQVQSTLEEYETSTQFDLATMRMVVEHVATPERFVGALSRLIRPGGLAILWTVNLWSPITMASWLVPFALHHRLKQMVWSGADHERDTFPVQYRMNTRAKLRHLFNQADFDELAFAKLDDLSLFGEFRRLNYLELSLWQCLKTLGLHYPENCLLGVYRREA